MAKMHDLEIYDFPVGAKLAADDYVGKLRAMVRAAAPSSMIWDFCLPLCGGCDSSDGVAFMKGREIDVAILKEGDRVRIDLQGDHYWVERLGESWDSFSVRPENGAAAEHQRLEEKFWDKVCDEEGWGEPEDGEFD